MEREKKRAMDALRALDEELRIARQESADAKKQVGHDGEMGPALLVAMHPLTRRLCCMWLA